jgi:hypothetical protein
MLIPIFSFTVLFSINNRQNLGIIMLIPKYGTFANAPKPQGSMRSLALE